MVILSLLIATEFINVNKPNLQGLFYIYNLNLQITHSQV